MGTAFVILALGIGLVAAQTLLRRGGALVGWAAFVVVPLCLTPFWIRGELNAILEQRSNPIAFAWVKLYTMLFCGVWGTAVRRTSLGKVWWVCVATNLLLVVNIAEAVVQDAFGNSPAHYLNAAAGVLLIATIPFGRDAVQVDAAGRHRDLMCMGMTRGWIVGYTVWNWVFVYLNYPLVCGQHLAVLGAPLLVGLIRPAIWLQMRAYSLAVWMMLIFSAPALLVAQTDTAQWSDARLELFGAASSFLFATVHVLTVARRNFVSNALGKPTTLGECTVSIA